MSTSTASIPENIPEMTPSDLRERLAADHPVTILDIRPESEFAEWRVPSSLNWPIYHHLARGERPDASEAPVDETPAVTVCGSGKKSRQAADLLREAGIEAYSLEGGLRAWTLAWNQSEVPVAGPASVVQIRRTGKGCLSYLVGSEDEAVAIDPAVDPGVYEEIADERGWTITAVADTHLHADHLSRARPLADRTRAELRLPAGDEVDVPHRRIRGGDRIPVGSLALDVIATPGHTPESVTFRLADEALITGDTLFLDAVGRPDLDGDREKSQKKSRQLYRSLERLADLPAELRVLPGHASRPVPFDREPVAARLETVLARIDVFGESEEQFVEALMERIPDTPPNHEKVIAHNRAGRFPPADEVIELEAGANRCAIG